ncbi:MULTISPECIES: glycine betaine/L-proline ABC transporter permease ProW [Delftia]|uniref:Glycine betaine/L-proline ABC transporter permease ProW n=1 Tax=Delftia lacustris TaxID=558537 RepID=A0A7T2YWW9_9BURK|nr:MULTISPECIES: glycine betaine/L-proline ABC transporter permease ProW [Delftia]KAA9173740.1 glycine betaine/L-proline ABC transporter permease ProW [Delftia sp. BR1]PZP64852.1 MAG: proline/glycine betaine ABC transporter permease ProW [Delftia acidovorans]EPD41030.1 glycine betaine/proline transport system permease [Delftia acidovorans CCUG 15835]EPD44632.1 glycine betaine/proline transport system permease [Delftia acidovorans CCUG 274B]MBS3722582.1 Glycine betaine/choline transport system 
MSDANNNLNPNTAAAATDPWAEAGANANAAPAADPWAAASTQAPADASPDPWGAASSGDAPGGDWLGASAGVPDDAQASLWHQLTTDGLPVQGWINSGLEWVVHHFRPFFQAVRTPIDGTLSGITDAMLALPWPLLILILTLVAWQFAGRAMAIGAAVSLVVVAMLGIWPEAMVTLSLVLTSLVFCMVIGLPVGILLASSDRAQRWTRPLLDAMQTTPAFVYLVPVVMLFGIGNVPGVIVTIIFALPPLIRLTNLGIRQVRPDLIEASRAYGASPWQLLWKVQLPLAMPSIMAGVNQALMLSLSMVVIASMIAVGGLGQMVLRGIGRLDMGLATVGGLGIVLLAIVLDRITQAMGQTTRGGARWWHSGPAGCIARLLGAGSKPVHRGSTS